MTATDADPVPMPTELKQFFAHIVEVLVDSGPRLVGSLVIAVVGWIAASLTARGIRSLSTRTSRLDATLAPLLVRLARWTVLGITLVMVLDQLGVDTTGVIAVLGTMGLALGLALKDTISDVAAGVVLLVLRPFSVGETVSIGGVVGTIESIELFTTHMVTVDGIPTVFPNNKVRGSDIQNYTRSQMRRIDLTIGIAYQDDIAKAIGVLQGIIRSEERCLAEPEPLVNVMELADSSVNLLMRCWVNAADFFPAKLDLTRKAKEELDKAGVSIPFPQRDIHLFNKS